MLRAVELPAIEQALRVLECNGGDDDFSGADSTQAPPPRRGSTQGDGFLNSRARSQFAPFPGIEVPRQERLDILRDLASGPRAVLEIPRQPFPSIELPERQRGKEREQRRR